MPIELFTVQPPSTMAPLIRDLAIILCTAAFVTLFFQRIRQPVVFGYLIAGMIIGPLLTQYNLVLDLPNLHVWSELGVIFLLFSLGLEFSFRKLSRVGVSASVTAILEMSGLFLLGFFAALSLGWRKMDALFTAAMLCVSSTTIIVRTLEELQLKTRRFAERIYAILIVEDLIAILLLLALSSLAIHQKFSFTLIASSAARLILVVTAWFMMGYLLLPRLLKWIGKNSSQETLLLISLGLCLSLSVLASRLGFSEALGAFILGSIIAESTESWRIEERIGPLKDLFSAIFFVSVGMLMEPSALLREWLPIAVLTLIVLLGKTFFVTGASLLTGQTLRSSIQIGFGMAQIGEFSFIIAGLGSSLKVTSDRLYPIAVAVSLFTTLLTPTLNRISHRLAVTLESRLPLSIKDFISRYSALIHQLSLSTEEKQNFNRCLTRWVLNALIVSVIFILSHELMLPQIFKHLDPIPARLTGWGVTLIFSLPFLWALGNTFPTLIPRAITLLLIGLLSTAFIPWYFVLGVLTLLFLVCLLFFKNKLPQAYYWIEGQFLQTFAPQSKTTPSRDILRTLAPWDAHLIRLKVHPNSEFVLKRLGQTDLRSTYGLNVVVIQRGLRNIIAPKADEIILPKDELLVLGTDEEVDQVRASIEKPPGLQDRFRINTTANTSYDLVQIEIDEESALCGKTIKASGIRSEYNALVVGVEREGKRTLNPPANWTLTSRDTLWIVGEENTLKLLSETLTSGRISTQDHHEVQTEIGL